MKRFPAASYAKTVHFESNYTDKEADSTYNSSLESSMDEEAMAIATENFLKKKNGSKERVKGKRGTSKEAQGETANGTRLNSTMW